MKNNEIVRVVCSEWIEGSGWSYSSTIDNIPLEEADADAYAREYFGEFLGIEDGTDYVIMIVNNETNEELDRSDWASSYINKEE